MADNKTLGFSIKIDGLSTEDNELAKLELHLKNIAKAKSDVTKAFQQGYLTEQQAAQSLASLNKESTTLATRQKELKKVVDDMPGSLNRMRAELIKAKDAASSTSAEIRERMSPYIKQMTVDVSKAEAAMGSHTRGVGDYTNSIKSAVSQIFALAAPAAAAAYALNGLKEAFAGTEAGVKLLSRAKVQMTAFFDAIVEGRWKYAFGNELPKDIKKVADMMNEIRIDERKEIVTVSEKELEIKNLRIDAIKAGKDSVEQVKLLTQAEEKEKDLITFKLGHKYEELEAVQLLLEKDKTNTEYLNKEAQLQADINNILGERSVRIASKLEAAQEKILAGIEKQKKAEQDYNDKSDKLRIDTLAKNLDAEDKVRKFYFDKWKKMVEDEKNANSFKKDLQKLLGISDKDMGLQGPNKKIQDDAEFNAKKAVDDNIKATKKTEDTILAIKQAGLQGAQAGADAAFNAKKARLQAEMTAELSNVNLTEAQKLAIKKKYGKQQQKTDVTQAVINTALAVGNALATTKPFIPFAIIAAALAAIQGGIQVAAIKSAQYARGGKITGGVPINTGTVDNRLIAVNESETVLTSKHVARLGGSGVMRRIGVPGYADGGYIGQRAPEIPSMGFDMNSLAKIINSIDVRLDINKVNSAQNELSVITHTNKI